MRTENIPQAVKDYRLFINYKQQYVADMVDMSIQGYGKLENGTNSFTIDRLYQVLKVLGFETIEALLVWHRDFQKLKNRHLCEMKELVGKP